MDIQKSTFYKKTQHASKCLKILSNPNRLAVLCTLLDKEFCAGDLEKMVDLSQPALSQHLARMKKEGLIDARKEGRSIFYSIKDLKIKRLIQAMHKIFCE